MTQFCSHIIRICSNSCRVITAFCFFSLYCVNFVPDCSQNCDYRHHTITEPKCVFLRLCRSSIALPSFRNSVPTSLFSTLVPDHQAHDSTPALTPSGASVFSPSASWSEELHLRLSQTERGTLLSGSSGPSELPFHFFIGSFSF